MQSIGCDVRAASEATGEVADHSVRCEASEATGEVADHSVRCKASEATGGVAETSKVTCTCVPLCRPDVNCAYRACPNMKCILDIVILSFEHSKLDGKYALIVECACTLVAAVTTWRQGIWIGCYVEAYWHISLG